MAEFIGMNSKSELNGLSTVIGIVTRVDDPLGMGRFQVYIPSVDRGNGVIESLKGSGSSLGSYSWAKLTSIASIPYYEHISEFIGTQVWLLFENGDTRSPVFIGTASNSRMYANGSTTNSYSSSTSGSIAALGSTTPTAYYPTDKYNGNYSEIVSITRQLILGRESGGKYTAVRWNDNGAISLGIMQWHGVRAKKVLSKIRSINPSGFDNICTANGSNLATDVVSDISWNKMVYSENSSSGRAILAILATSESKQAQDEIANEDIATYINIAMNAGVKDLAALVYVADIYNQYGNGGGSLSSAIAKGVSNGGTLADIHAAVHEATTQYLTRRDTVYNEICTMINDGKFDTISEGVKVLDPVTGVTVSADLQAGCLTWPVPGYTTVTSNFGSREPFKVSNGNTTSNNHYGIDIGAPSGASVVAAHNGTVTKVSENSSRGKFVWVTAGNIHTLYQHLSQQLVKVGQTVVAGQEVGKCGSTGDSTGPHLHFGLYVNGTSDNYSCAINPLEYLRR